MKGKKNGYSCAACGHMTVTLDVDDGVTPVFKRCRCGGQAMSEMYRIDQSLPHEGEWFRPSSTRGMSLDMREHIELGGLCYRAAALEVK